MSPGTLRLVMNLWPPYLFTGVHVKRIASDWSSAEVELRARPWNRNYVGTHFGGTLFSMTDPFFMLLVLRSLGKDYIVWDKQAEIDFVNPGRGLVRCQFQVPRTALDDIRSATASGEKYLRWFETEIRGDDGVVVARVRKQLYVRLKPGRQAA
jgi:acyl-coenzyme A thioesterase PaaI-like protein